MGAMSQSMALLTSHASEEWYTPAWVLELAREVLGAIDLDPASCETANRTVRAHFFFTERDDGLEREWWGRVWNNPPYGKFPNGDSKQGAWSRKAATEYEAGRVQEALLLVNTSNGYDWYQWLSRRYPVCLMEERLRFVRPDGAPGDRAKKGQSVFYLGRRPLVFRYHFAPVGRVLLPHEGYHQ